MVFFFQQPVPNGHGWTPDLSPAEPFGKLDFIFGLDDRPSRSPASLREKAKEKLKGFDPAKDYVCWCNSGDVCSIFLVISILTEMGFDYVRTLNWHKPRGESDTGRYVPADIPLS